MTSFIRSISPEKAAHPYCFYTTNRNVYSLEELYYHCYHYWKQSVDDFLTGKLEEWIETNLGLHHIARQIAKVNDEKTSITDQYISFLGLIDYFYEKELNTLRNDIYCWENKADWERCKEKADDFMKQNKQQEAIKWYKKTLVFEENSKLFNNIGIAYMRNGQYNKAIYYLNKAHQKDPKNLEIILNIVQVSMMQQNYKQAAVYLNKASCDYNTKEIWFHYGELFFAVKEEKKAIEAYRTAIHLGSTLNAPMALARIYVKHQRYEKAVEQMKQVPQQRKNVIYWIEMANIYEQWGKEAEAIQYIEKSIVLDSKQILCWITLARLYRKKRLFIKAHEVIQQALQIDQEDEMALLEYARIQKDKGQEKDYQLSLKGILFKMIGRYRQKNI
jgi:tetratricopeptide (TPR) repeat protein